MISIQKYETLALDKFQKITNYKIDKVKDGIIYVHNNVKYGFINLKVKNILNLDESVLMYDEMSEFKNGVAIVSLDDKQGIIDETGAYILEPTNAKITALDDEIYEVSFMKSGFHMRNSLNKNNYKVSRLYNIKIKKINDIDLLNLKPLTNHLYQADVPISKTILLDSHFNVVYESNNCHSFEVLNDNYIKIRNLKNQLGIIDFNGKEIIETMYDYIKLSNSVFFVQKDQKIGLRDLTGKQLIEEKFDEIVEIKNGYFIYALGRKRKKGIQSFTGEEIVKPIYDQLVMVNKHKFFVKKSHNSGHWYILDLNKSKDLPSIFDSQNRLKDYTKISSFQNGVAIAKHSQSYTLIDENGKELTEPFYRIEYIGQGLYYDIYHCSYSLKDGQDILYNSFNNYSSSKYHSIVKLKNGLFKARLRTNNSYVLLGSNGILLTVYQYDQICEFKDGYAYASRNKNYYLIDKNGQEVICFDKEIIDYQVQGNLVYYNYHPYGDYNNLKTLQNKEIFSHIEDIEFKIVNDELLIINNYLVPISELKIKYNLTISYKNSLDNNYVYQQTFDSKQKRETVIQMFENDIIDSIDNLNKTKQKKRC